MHRGRLTPSPWAFWKFKLLSGTETEHTWAGAEMGGVTVTPITVLARGERSFWVGMVPGAGQEGDRSWPCLSVQCSSGPCPPARTCGAGSSRGETRSWGRAQGPSGPCPALRQPCLPHYLKCSSQGRSRKDPDPKAQSSERALQSQAG